MKLLPSSLFAVLMLFTFSAHANTTHDHNKEKENKVLFHLMQAISQNDYDAFVSNGSAKFKTTITKKGFNSVEKSLGSLIRDGYKAEYLTELNQQGKKVHLWKISYEKSKENTLAKLVISEAKVKAKVAGFWLQ